MTFLKFETYVFFVITINFYRGYNNCCFCDFYIQILNSIRLTHNF